MFHHLLESVLPKFDHYLAIYIFSSIYYNQAIIVQLYIFLSNTTDTMHIQDYRLVSAEWTAETINLILCMYCITYHLEKWLRFLVCAMLPMWWFSLETCYISSIWCQLKSINMVYDKIVTARIEITAICQMSQQAVTHWLPTTEVQSSGICYWQIGAGAGFLRALWFSRQSSILSTHSIKFPRSILFYFIVNIVNITATCNLL
jgi:hypothetical protein